MKLGDKASWDFLFERYINAFETATEQALMLTALGCTSDVQVLQSCVFLYKYSTEQHCIQI
jgi:hypothetical protein